MPPIPGYRRPSKNAEQNSKDRNRFAASSLWMYFPVHASDDIHIAHRVGQVEIESDLAAYRLLEIARDKVTNPTGLRCLDDMLNALKEKLISHRLKKTAHAILDP